MKSIIAAEAARSRGVSEYSGTVHCFEEKSPTYFYRQWNIPDKLKAFLKREPLVLKTAP